MGEGSDGIDPLLSVWSGVVSIFLLSVQRQCSFLVVVVGRLL